MTNQINLISRPYVRPVDIARYTGLSKTTVHRIIKESGIQKYPRIGYLTTDVIRAFKLSPYLSMLESLDAFTESLRRLNDE